MIWAGPVNKINWTGLVTMNLSNNILETSVLSIIHNISFNIKILPVIYQYVKTTYWYLCRFWIYDAICIHLIYGLTFHLFLLEIYNIHFQQNRICKQLINKQTKKQKQKKVGAGALLGHFIFYFIFQTNTYISYLLRINCKWGSQH